MTLQIENPAGPMPPAAGCRHVAGQPAESDAERPRRLRADRRRSPSPPRPFRTPGSNSPSPIPAPAFPTPRWPARSSRSLPPRAAKVRASGLAMVYDMTKLAGGRVHAVQHRHRGQRQPAPAPARGRRRAAARSGAAGRRQPRSARHHPRYAAPVRPQRGRSRQRSPRRWR